MVDQVRRFMRPEDLFGLTLSGLPNFSPMGNEIAFTSQRMDKRENKYFSNIFLVSVDSSEVLQFTYGDFRDRLPRFSPDGRSIAFISNRNGSDQIFLIPRKGGEAEPLTDLPVGGIAGLNWAPDGSKLVFSFHENQPLVDDGFGYCPDPEDKIDSTEPRVRLLTRLRFKEDPGGFLGGGRSHLYVTDLPSRKTTQITNGDFDHYTPVFSPDTTEIAFYAIREEEDDILFPRMDLWAISITGGEPRLITERYGPPIAPVWSPDAKQLTYIGYIDHEHAHEHNIVRVISVPMEGGAGVPLTLNSDANAQIYVAGDAKVSGSAASPPVYSPDGRFIYYAAMEKGHANIYSYDQKNKSICQISEGFQTVIDFCFCPKTSTFALLVSEPEYPQDLFLLSPPDASGQLSEQVRLTEMNQELLDKLTLGKTEEFYYDSFDGVPIHGLILTPPDFDPTRKYPLLLNIHGGPHIMAGANFFHEFHVLSAAGYIVVALNHRGSQGFGEDFCAAITGDWGNLDYKDIMACVENYIEKLPYVDKDRLGITGGSFGGYMANWAITQTNRFKAAVSHRSCTNLTSMSGTTDFASDTGRELGALPWEDDQHLMKMSPLKYVKNVETPIMLVQSDNDSRTPVEQAEQFYFALKFLGKEAAFLRFPEEAHELSRSGRPDRRMERLYRIVWWFKKYM